jgi:PAS domain S-box-containing protein
MSVVLTAVVFGGRAGVAALAAGSACFLVYGSAGRQTTAPLWADHISRPEAWLRMTATFALFGGLLVLLVATALRRMERSLAEARSSLDDALAARRERDLAEQGLRENEERWRRISEATFEGIAFSRDGVVVDANAQLAELLGYLVPELVGRPVTDLVAPEDRPRVAAAIRSAQTQSYQHLALRKDGSTLLVETRARSVTRDGQPLRVTAVRDVSERQRLEAELRRRETLAAMGSLVAGVAHEVRTPLFSLSATLDALEAGSGTPQQQGELKELLRSQVRRLSSLMQDLLDYGRPPNLKTIRAGIWPAVQRAARSCGSLAAQAGVEVSLALPEDLPEVDADLGRLEQVFENLIANAIQHAPRGSTVRLTARRTHDPRPGLACAIEDEGSGLLPSDLEHVFDPFFSRRKGGTGMGLPIAQRFVEAHGGSLSAGNRGGAGAVFTVFLPAADAAKAGGAVA